MMAVPNPRDRRWGPARTAGEILKHALAVLAIAYGVAGALVLTALMARVGPRAVAKFMGESVAAAWRWFAKLAGLGA